MPWTFFRSISEVESFSFNIYNLDLYISPWIINKYFYICFEIFSCFELPDQLSKCQKHEGWNPEFSMYIKRFRIIVYTLTINFPPNNCKKFPIRQPQLEQYDTKRKRSIRTKFYAIEQKINTLCWDCLIMTVSEIQIFLIFQFFR